MWKVNDNDNVNDNKSSTSFLERRVAEGMAMALWPAERSAQQSEAPSAM